MSLVTIEESDDERSIVTPDMRLRFRWVSDRWTHSIDIGPGPWQTLTDAVEWDPEKRPVPALPTYQELHFHNDGQEMLALLVGQSGPHHFSASFRVKYRSYRQRHFDDPTILQDRSESLIEVDVADRCRTEGSLEAHYIARQPPIDLYLSAFDDGDSPRGFLTPMSSIVWEARTPATYDVSFAAWKAGAPTTVSVIDRSESGDWNVRAVPDPPSSSSPTRRFGYTWAHHRVNPIFAVREGESPTWSLVGSPPPGDGVSMEDAPGGSFNS